MAFNLAEALQSPVAEYEIDNEYEADDELEVLLDDAIEAITNSSDAITETKTFDVYCSVLKHSNKLPASMIAKLRDSLKDGFQTELANTVRDEQDDQQGAMEHKDALEMYAFLFHWFVLAARDVKAAAEVVGPATPVKAKKGKGKATKGTSRAKSKKDSENWSWAEHIPDALDTVIKVSRELKSNRVWPVSSEREAFVTCITEPIYIIAQEQTYMKIASVKDKVLKAICYAVKYQNHHNVAHTKIFSHLQFHEHLAEPLADCLSMLENPDFDHPQLATDILTDLSKHTFLPDKGKEDRIFARFIVHFSEICPKRTLKQIALLVDQLDSESYPMRIAIVEVLYNLIVYLDGLKRRHELEEEATATNHVNDFLRYHLLPRALDASTYVRAKVLSVLARFCAIQDNRYYKLRLKITQLAGQSLEDKATAVRKNAVILLKELMKSHPYNRYQGILDQDVWKMDYDDAMGRMQALGLEKAAYNVQNLDMQQQKEEEDNGAPKTKKKKKRQRPSGDEDDMEVDDTTDVDEEEEEEDDESDDDEEDGDDEAMQVDEEDEPRPTKPKKNKKKKQNLGPRPSIGDFNVDMINEEIANRKLNEKEVEAALRDQRYAKEGLTFITYLEDTRDTMLQLLGSVNKTEVLEAIDFFYTASVIGLKLAKPGIRQMLHLIWQKDSGTMTSEDGQEVKGVRQKLLDCYHSLYFTNDAGDPSPPKDIVRNLIELTFEADLAHLTSLEEMLRIMMTERQIGDGIVRMLWKIYSTDRNIPKVQRRGAIVLLSMLALANPSIMDQHSDTLLEIGFEQYGPHDLMLARYTSVGLQRLNGSAKKVKGSMVDKSRRYDMDHKIFTKLSKFILRPSRSKEWFGVAEQIINTVYALGDHPDVFCNVVIKELTRKAFARRASNDDPDTQMSEDGEEDKENDPDAMDEDDNPPISQNSAPTGSQEKKLKDPGDAFQLAQLLFVVGHVAIKQIVFLELVEREMKRQREPEAPGQGVNASKEVEELDQVVGNAEDEIGDDLAKIRESSLLYGETSLLRVYGPMLRDVCLKPKTYRNATLRAAATLSLSKFLCVSSQFCSEHHKLLFGLLEVSTSASIRSNIAIALGDVAVSFSTIIDENSHELYRGLSDKDLMVKKNTLMVLTHLILNGMIKVKGQLGEMAKCLVDENERIKGLAELFFKELSTKDNAIYNNLPDVISHLSTGPHAVEEEHFQNIMTHIFKYIEKDKQTESIVEKLCQRFHLTDAVRQWRDIAFCLSLLPFKSEKSLRKLVDGLPYYRDKLHDEQVFDRFNQILTKARQNKGAGKPDAEINDFQRILETCKEQGEEDNALEQRVQGKKAAAKKRAKRGAASAAPAPPQRTTRRQKRQVKEDDEDEDDGLS